MTNRTLDRIFTIAATFSILMALFGAAMSATTGEWMTLTWQLIAAVGFVSALGQARRANRTEANR